MKNQFFIISAMLLIFSTTSANGVHAKAKNPVTTSKAVTIKVNSVDLKTDVQPYINEKGHVMAPVRFLSETMGYEVEWVDKDQTVVLKNYYGNTISVKVGQDNELVNQKALKMEEKAIIKQSRVFVPIIGFYENTTDVAMELDKEKGVLNVTNWGPTKELLQIYKMFPGSKPYGFDLYCSLDGKADIGKFDFRFTTDVIISDTSCIFNVEKLNDSTMNVIKKVLEVYYPNEYEKAYEKVKKSINSADDKIEYFDDRALRIYNLEDNGLQLNIGHIGVKVQEI